MKMYGRGSYLTIYCRKYRRREKKIRFWKRIFMTAMSLCVIVSAAFALPQIPLGEVFAAAKTDGAQHSEAAGKVTVSGNVLSGHTVSGNGLSDGTDQISDTTMLSDVVSGSAVSDKAAIVEALIEENAIPVIFIDAGHGGEDEGCARAGIQEKTINLKIAGLVQTQLEALGYKVIMARTDDTYIAKEDRVQAANDARADIYVSIHQNAADDISISGMEVWYDGSDGDCDNKRLAQLIRQQTAAAAEVVERELRDDADFHVTGNTAMPSCLIETGFLSNADERNKLATAEYQEEIAKGIVQGIEYYFHPKTMYLTFDDGPSEENTLRVLEILKERDIKATFFLIGENVRKCPEIAQKIVAEGHTIGIHCDSHDYETIYASADSFIQDFETAHQTVYEVTGVDAKLFRFPGGSINAYNSAVRDEIIEKMEEKGYVFYDWNASLEDAVNETTPEELIANGVGSTLGRKKVILLAHDVVYDTGICLNDLIDSFPEYEMQPLDEGVEPVQFGERKG